MNSKKCCFTGHGRYPIEKQTKEKLYNKCKELIISENVNEFWVGNYGLFDETAYEVVRKLQNNYNKIELCLVVPYLTKKLNDFKEDYYKKYNNIVVADIPENTPKRLHIIKCNQYMINECDFLVGFVNYDWGGAFKTLEYANKKKHIKVFNVGSLSI